MEAPVSEQPGQPAPFKFKRGDLVAFMGYVFTVVRRRTGSIVPSVIMHTAHNSMIFGITALAMLLGQPSWQ